MASPFQRFLIRQFSEMSVTGLMNLIRSQRTAQIGIALVFACALAIAISSGNSLRFLDEMDYNDLAESLLHHHAFNAENALPTLARPPGYPFVLAAMYALVDSPLVAKLVNCLALLASTYLLMRLSERLCAFRTALVPFVVLCYPLFFYAASTLYPQTLGGLLLLGTIVLLSDKEAGVRTLIVAGVLFGVLCLMIPSFMYILPFLALYVMYQWRARPREMLLRAIVMFLLTGLTIAPWTTRNAVEFHAFVPVSANGGFNLAVGNSAFTPVNGKGDVHRACPDVSSPDEAERDSLLAACAVKWIRANPGPAFRLYVAKFFNYFNYRNELSTSTEQKAWQEWLVFATYYPLLGLAFVRLWFWRRYRFSSLEALLYVIYFANAALTAVFFTRLRFRIPFDLLLVAIDAAFVSWLLRSASSSWSQQPAGETRVSVN
jgi:hypothetical protein